MKLTGFSPDTKSIVENIDDSESLKCFGEISVENIINIIFGACLKEKTLSQPFKMICFAD
jgi:hypothetical protein